MKTFLRITTLALALLMMVSVAVACATPSDDTDAVETTTPAAQGGENTPADGGDTPAETTPSDVDENGFKLDELPEDLDYNQAEVMVLHWNSERDEFYVESITGDNILDAIYERNMAIEDRLNVKLAFEEEKGDNGNRNTFIQRVSNSFSAGEGIYDIVATYSRTAAQLAIQGFYADLNDIPDSYINYDMPWWPESIIDTMGVGDALYYVSGDASTNTLHFMYTLYYNKDLLNNLGLADPTEFVLNNTWTIDKLIEMTTNQYQDLDNSGNLSEGDFYGFGTIYYGADAFYTGSDLKLVERTNDEDLIKISDDYFSQKTIDLVDKLGNWMTTNDCWISRSGDAVDFDLPFVNGNMLFCQNRVYMADNKHGSGLNGVEWKYGLVPTPLYDEAQENYITVIGNPFTLYGIMTDCKQPEIMTAVIECWGSESYRRTTPALFETNMKYKYTDLDVSVQMFDILRETSSFDQGRIYSNTLGPYISEIPSKIATVGGSWATTMKTYQRMLGRQLDQIISSFQEIQG